VREHLRGLVSVAQAAKPTDAPVVDNVPATQQQALEALHAWHRDWSETARAVVRRRDHLILMGLAKRRTSKTDDSAREEPSSPLGGAVPVATPQTTTTATSPAPIAAQ
jgi:hypothetical protein